MVLERSRRCCTDTTKFPAGHVEDYQPFPRHGKLANNMDLALADLRRLLDKDDRNPVYAYVLTSVEPREGGFAQAGCAPNFQADLVTLCTCKHQMRTARPLRASDGDDGSRVDSWKGVWVAGFASLGATLIPTNGLFYLMNVRNAYASHYDLWMALPSNVRRAKAASRHRLGDLYEPIAGRVSPNEASRFNPESYRPPLPDHTHWPHDWHGDIFCQGYGDRTPALLVGDPSRSYIWSAPTILSTRRQPRTKRYNGLSELMDQLQRSGDAE